MSRYSLGALADSTLLSRLHALVVQDRLTTAELLAHIAEVDARRLYAPAGYASMFAWCVGELGFSEDAAKKRLQAARTAREFPVLFEALADGRLHLSAVVLLAPHLTEANFDELVVAASRKSRFEIECLLARRSQPALEPASDPAPAAGERAPGHVDPTQVVANAGSICDGTAREPVGQTKPEPSLPRPKLVPIGPGVYSLQVPLRQDTFDRLQRAKDLLSHAIPDGDLGRVLDRALETLVRQLERRKFGAAAKRAPRAAKSANPRHIPAHVRRAVCERDGGRCTFTSDAGRRCEATRFLEFDHIVAVARGGASTPGNLRLRCRAHNQMAAERAFGAGFMAAKRRPEAGFKAGKRRAEADPAPDPDLDVEPWLRQLGYRADEARAAARSCEGLAGGTLEDRVKRALAYFRPRIGSGGASRFGAGPAAVRPFASAASPPAAAG